MSHARYQLGAHVTGLPVCGAACKDDRTLLGLVCGSEKFTELCYVCLSFYSSWGNCSTKPCLIWLSRRQGKMSGCLGSVVELFDAQYRTVE